VACVQHAPPSSDRRALSRAARRPTDSPIAGAHPRSVLLPTDCIPSLAAALPAFAAVPGPRSLCVLLPGFPCPHSSMKLQEMSVYYVILNKSAGANLADVVAHALSANSANTSGHPIQCIKPIAQSFAARMALSAFSSAGCDFASLAAHALQKCCCEVSSASVRLRFRYRGQSAGGRLCASVSSR
jgi:hypothetical protein